MRMLIWSIITIAIAIPPFNKTVTSIHYTRISVMVFLLCITLGTTLNVDMVELYHALFSTSYLTISMDSLLYIVCIIVLVCASPADFKTENQIKSEYSIILIFGVLGATIILSANDLISIYVCLELQSFSLYILACIYTTETGSTAASLKYFLLGAISSAFILLGIAIIYTSVGTTSNQSLFFLEEVSLNFGFICILCGFIFKISAAPFHSWFSEVVQGVPTHVAIIIINLPKISIITFLFNLLLFAKQTDFLFFVSLISLVVGTVAGLNQTKIKKLLAFSTISHVGFILIGLNALQSVNSINAVTFYLVQYSITAVLAFLIIFSVERYHQVNRSAFNIDYISNFQGLFRNYKLLSFSLTLCLFSIAGIPPITGFYAKLIILQSAIQLEQSLLFMMAIICSVISAAYYLKIIKALIFDQVNYTYIQGNSKYNINPVQSYSMATIMILLSLFILDADLLINCTELVALSNYIT